MTIRAILKHPDHRLRLVAGPVPEMSPAILELCDDMIETMNAANALGLAAPQVGESLRIFVVDTRRGVFINPEIIERMGTEHRFAEGCLSLPNLQRYVVRSAEIVVRARTRGWELFEQRFYGVDAVAIQHELDHLDGVLMIDKGKPVQPHLPDPIWKSRSKKRRRALTP